MPILAMHLIDNSTCFGGAIQDHYSPLVTFAIISKGHLYKKRLCCNTSKVFPLKTDPILEEHCRPGNKTNLKIYSYLNRRTNKDEIS